jgi:putative ABC transport system substrate-binding protein
MFVFIALDPFLKLSLRRLPRVSRPPEFPATDREPEHVQPAGLMVYGPGQRDLYRRAASMVDKSLKGVKTAELPVEQPTKFELIINLKAAKQIGLTIPPNVLARADKVIR